MTQRLERFAFWTCSSCGGRVELDALDKVDLEHAQAATRCFKCVGRNTKLKPGELVRVVGPSSYAGRLGIVADVYVMAYQDEGGDCVADERSPVVEDLFMVVMPTAEGFRFADKLEAEIMVLLPNDPVRRCALALLLWSTVALELDELEPVTREELVSEFDLEVPE